MTALGSRRRRQVFTHSSWASRRERLLRAARVPRGQRPRGGRERGADAPPSGRGGGRPVVDAAGRRRPGVLRGGRRRRRPARGLRGRRPAGAARRRPGARGARHRPRRARRGGDRCRLARPRRRRASASAVLEAFGPAIDAAVPGERDPKTSLQERAARHRRAVAYELVDTAGPPQRRVFTSRVRVGGEVLGRGPGPSKQASERRPPSRPSRAARGGARVLSRLTVRGLQVVRRPDHARDRARASTWSWARTGRARATWPRRSSGRSASSAPGRLRAGGMADVLYSGGDRRPAAQFAEVGLVLSGDGGRRTAGRPRSRRAAASRAPATPTTA